MIILKSGASNRFNSLWIAVCVRECLVTLKGLQTSAMNEVWTFISAKQLTKPKKGQQKRQCFVLKTKTAVFSALIKAFTLRVLSLIVKTTICNEEWYNLAE